jgi:organic radical activating enzyme
MFKNNCCDGIYNSYDVHFTSDCDNRCAHCIDSICASTHIHKPDVEAITSTIINNSEGYDDVLFLGGEPCLYLDELIECIRNIKQQTDLKCYVTTSLPYICYKERDRFYELIKMCDGINISAQHYDESVADDIRKTKSRYDRQKFYAELPYKEKIRINLNIVKPYLYEKDDILKCLKHYDDMGFPEIKLSEIQHGSKYFVSFEKLFGIKLKSPYSHGCQTVIDMKPFIEGYKGKLILKRSCFMCEETLKASFTDGMKAVYRLFSKPDNKYGIVYEDGSISRTWR